MMGKKLGFIISFVIYVMMIFAPAMAEEYPEVGFDFEAYEAEARMGGTPKLARWSYTASTSQDLSIDKKEATACASVTGYKDKVTKIVMFLYIQQLDGKEWKTLDSDHFTFNSWHASKEITYSPCPYGHTYRLKANYYVYSGTEYEYIQAETANLIYN